MYICIYGTSIMHTSFPREAPGISTTTLVQADRIVADRLMPC